MPCARWFCPEIACAVRLVRAGEEAGQGVGYLEDGTMVVVEQGRDSLNSEVEVTVTKLLQTSAGRMIFGRLGGEGATPSQRPAAGAEAIGGAPFIHLAAGLARRVKRVDSPATPLDTRGKPRR